MTGLVNNAGRLIEADVVSLTEEQWDAVLDVNLKGAWRMTRALVPAMLEAGGGAIVQHLLARGAGRPSRARRVRRQQGGLLNLTRAVAVDFGRRGIRCNAICPGSIETALLSQHLESTGGRDGRRGRPDRSQLRRAAGPARRGRRARPCFLLSREAEFINGSHIVIDGARGATT